MKSEMKQHKNKQMNNKIKMNNKMKKSNKINKKIINQKIKYVKLKTGKNKEKAYKEKIYPYRYGEDITYNETIMRTIFELGMRDKTEQTYKPYCEQKREIEPEIREKGIIIYDNENCEVDVFKAKIPTIMKTETIETKIWKPEYKRRVKVELERITRWEETPEELVKAAMLNQTEVYRIVEIIGERE